MDKRLIGFYLDSLIANMLFFTPIYSIAYFLDIGFSLTQIGFFLAATSLFSVLSEIPTGIVADLYGRKKSTIIGYLVVSLATMTIFLSTNFWILIAAHALIGTGRSFISGAVQAWLNSLVGDKKFQKVYGHIQSLNNAGLLISGFVGVFVVTQFGLRSIWFAVFFSYVLGAIFLTTVPEQFKVKKIKNPYKSYVNQLKSSFTIIKKSINLKYFLISSTIFAMLIPLATNITWIPLLLNLGYNEALLGYVWTGMAAVGIFAPLLGNKITDHFPRKKFNIIMMLAWAVVLFVLPFAPILAIAIGILFLTVLFDYSRLPSNEAIFQSLLPEKYRATLGSVLGILFSLGMVLIEPIAGLLAETITPAWTLFIAGILLLPAAYFFSKIEDKA